MAQQLDQLHIRATAPSARVGALSLPHKLSYSPRQFPCRPSQRRAERPRGRLSREGQSCRSTVSRAPFPRHQQHDLAREALTEIGPG